ncbi:MAG TPA: SBBP repeat-containing protein, partial [Planctomycetota bacterium]|nr:SBBP repeat-containing protein [Planctomycetota bacterium]
MHCGTPRCETTTTFETLEPRLLLSGALELFELSPALFVANEGQWADEAVRYAYLRDGANVLFTDAGPVFQVFAGESYAEVAVTFDGSNVSRAEGRDVSDAVFNYYTGDPSSWREGVGAYETVAYPGLYDGIDLVTWGRRDGLKYEFHVAPWTDYRQVRLSYDGVASLSIDETGRLHAVTSAGELIEAAPVIYQQRAGVRVEVPGRFQLLDADTVTFVLTGAYDPTVELIIDPDLEWSSYLGGSGNDIGRDVACDGAGALLLTGQTDGGAFPTTGGFDTSYNTNTDVFVTRVSAEGDLVWSSYLGGSAWEAGQGIDTDAAGNVFVTGQTLSSNFPTTGGFDTSLGGGADAFVTKIRGDGGAILWSSYLGGGSTDGGNALVVTSTGDVYAVGSTFSTDFNTTGGLYPAYNDLCDAFVAKITGAGAYVWGTYLGSADYDQAWDVAVDSQDNPIVTGVASADDFPAGNGGPSTWRGGYDVFVVKLTANCGWVWGDLLG